MQELADERRALTQLLSELSDESFQVETWVFETDAQASDHSIRQVYLDALDQSDLYIGIFWNGYGEWTIDEFHRAGEVNIPRHLYVKNVDADERDPRLSQFLEKQSDVRFGITPRWYQDVADFKVQVTRSIQLWLQNQELAYHSSISAVVATLADEVPELPRRLIGRKNLTDRVLTLLEDNDRILLRGFGGTGKTALAATIAADYIDNGAGDVIWIKTGTAGVDSIYEALGRAFDQQQEVHAAEGDARAQIVRRILAKHKGLLVLDDVWNGNALARIAKILPRRMPLLATSRQIYPLDEVFEIGKLDADEALKLLEYHARMDLANDVDVEHLCDVLGNHAFALEIAGKTLKVYSLTPSDLLQRIEEAPHELNIPAGFGELGRTGIKSLLDASIDSLNRELYDTYVTLGGLFEPTATAELIGKVMNVSKEETDTALQELVQRGLLNEREKHTVGYYQLHDLAYSYARTTFTSKGLSYQPVIIACRDFALEHASDLSYLDVEISNVLEAAETAFINQDVQLLIDIVNALTVGGPYFAARGHTIHTLELLRSAIDCAEAIGATETAHYLWGKLGNTYADFLGQLDLALDAYQKALQFAREMGDSRREAILLTVIGTVHFRQGTGDSDQYHQQAESIARKQDDAIVLAQILSNRGVQALDKDSLDFDAAKGRDLSAEAAAIAEKHDLKILYFYSMLNQGAGQHELGHYDDALSTHQRVYEFAQSEENHRWMADALFAIGEDYHELNKREQAQQSLDKALQLYRDTRVIVKINTLTNYMTDHNYTISS